VNVWVNETAKQKPEFGKEGKAVRKGGEAIQPWEENTILRAVGRGGTLRGGNSSGFGCTEGIHQEKRNSTVHWHKPGRLTKNELLVKLSNIAQQRGRGGGKKGAKPEDKGKKT